MTPKKMNQVPLKMMERVVAVVPEYCSGPGWSNRLVTVHIVNFAENSYRAEYLQFDEISRELQILFHVGAGVCEQLINCVPTKKVIEK